MRVLQRMHFEASLTCSNRGSHQISDIENRHDFTVPEDSCAGQVPHAGQLLVEGFDQDFLFSEDFIDGKGDALPADLQHHNRDGFRPAGPGTLMRQFEGLAESNQGDRLPVERNGFPVLDSFDLRCLHSGDSLDVPSGDNKEMFPNADNDPAKSGQRQWQTHPEGGSFARDRFERKRSFELLDFLLYDGEAETTTGDVRDVGLVETPG